MTPSVSLCRLEEIADGEARGFVLGEGAARRWILVARRGAAVYGYVNSCPHAGTPLDWVPDQFMTPDRRFLLCHTHGARFRVEDGFCTVGPCRGDSLEKVPVAVESGEIRLLPPLP